MSKRRLTVLADPETDSDVVKYFDGKPVTETGLKLIRGAMILDKAGLLDYLEMWRTNGMAADMTPIDLVKKALEISELLTAKSQNTPPVESKSRLSFGTAKSN